MLSASAVADQVESASWSEADCWPLLAARASTAAFWSASRLRGAAGTRCGRSGVGDESGVSASAREPSVESLGVVEEPGLKPFGAGVRVRGLKPPAPPVSVVLAAVVDWVGCAVSAVGVGGAPSAGTESGSAVVRGAGFSTPLRSGRDDRFMLGPSGMSFDVEEEESGVAGEEMGAVEEEIGVILTESMAMWPTASVSGYYFGHPESKYFGLGKIKEDQVIDYAKRRGISTDKAMKWLAPNIAD